MIVFLLLPLGFAGLSLAGWLLDLDGPTRVWVSSLPMNPATAVCLILLSLGAAIPARRPIGWAAVSLALFAAAAAISALKLIEVGYGVRLGVGALLFNEPVDTQSVDPIGMSPNSAFSAVVYSAALALLVGGAKERRAWPAQVLALIGAVAPTMAILGYLYGIPKFYRVAVFTPMAAAPALCFLSLSAFVLTATRPHGLTSPILDAGLGGRMARRLLPSVVIFPIAANWVRTIGERADLYRSAYGIGVMVALISLTAATLIWWNARTLGKLERARNLAERELAHAATHDFLTGVANRSLFMTRLEARLSSARRREADAFAIIFLDVDGFKAVNDRCGHAAGDALLCRIANVLLTCVREGDLVARLGGDEFAILLERISNEADPHVIAGRILTEVPQLTKPTPSDPTVGVSLGIVIADSPPLDGEALMARADSALYDAKRRGKGRATVFAVAG